MAQRYTLNVNGVEHTFDAEPDSPLLYVLSDKLRLNGPRFGCGLAQCGACSVLLDGVEVRACVTLISSVGTRAVTTLEGLGARYAQRTGRGGEDQLHPVQQALLDEQAIQCGYCCNGMAVKATELLESNAQPSEQEIRSAMNGHLCRCGMYPRIIRAIESAADSIVADAAAQSTGENA